MQINYWSSPFVRLSPLVGPNLHTYLSYAILKEPQFNAKADQLWHAYTTGLMRL